MATNIPPHNLKEVVQRLGAAAGQSRAHARAAAQVDSRARFSDRRRDPQLGRGDPADLRDRAGDDQAARNLRAASRSAERRLDHLDSLRHRERRPGRADRRADRQGAGPATDERQGPEHRRHPDPARAQAGRQRRRGPGVSLQELRRFRSTTASISRACCRPRGPRSPFRPARFEDDPPAIPRFSAGDRHPPAANSSSRTCSRESTSSKASRSSSRTSTRRSRSFATATARPTRPPS